VALWCQGFAIWAGLRRWSLLLRLLSTQSAYRAAALLVGLPLMLHSPLAATQGHGSLASLEHPASEQQVSGPYRLTPERRALLDTIRYAEGTWIGGSAEGYRVIYGGSLAESLERHPERVVVRRYVSAAAGAYQFLPRTWQMAAAALALPDFGPRSQDQAALWLVDRRGALRTVDAQGLNAAVLARLAPEWASLPALHGGSYYGQPVRRVTELMAFYESRLNQLNQTAAQSRRLRVTLPV
jgi:muramidase (phage lysozyme)